MGKEGTGNNVLQKLEKRIKPKSKNGGKIEYGDIGINEFRNIGRNEVIEHMQRSEVENIAEMKRHHKRDLKKKKDRGTKDAEEVDKEKKGASKGKVIGVYCDDGNGNAMDNADRKRKRRENKKNRNEASDMPRFEVGSAEEVEVNEVQQRPLEESVPELKSGKEAKKERKKQKAMRNQKDGDIEKKGEKEGGTFSENIEASVLEKVERKKKKRERKNSKDDDCIGLQDNCNAAMMELEENRTVDNENKSEKMFETVSEDHNNNFTEKVKRKKKKSAVNKQDEGDLSVMQQENVPKNVKGNAQSYMHDGNITKKCERKKKHKDSKNFQDDSSAAQLDISMQEFVDTDSNTLLETDMTHDNEVENTKKGKKKKTKLVDNGLNDPPPSKSNKKVRFSGQVEVFPLPDDSGAEKGNNEEENLVRGKRFTPEENEIIKEAVYKYIQKHGLGEDGLDMVLNCSKHRKVKGCWKEIGAAIPYRPYLAIYHRAQVLFRRSESRKWTQEEYEMIRMYQEAHGNEWRALADELGKHRWHVKDTWRRIKLPNLKKGQWSQEEYQNLFDLVNTDLQLRVSQEKISKHGMLRDNISWTAISDKLSTRCQATCCVKWYKQLTSPMVAEGSWADTDDYRLLGTLYSLDASCMEDVDWDNLIDNRSGDVCQKRWNQMVLHIGHHGNKPFSEQVDTLAQRYCPHLLEASETWDSKPRVP